MDKKIKNEIVSTVLTFAALLATAVVVAVGGTMLALHTADIVPYIGSIAATAVALFVIYVVFYIYIRYIVGSGEIDSLPFPKLLAIEYFNVSTVVLL